MNVLLTSEEIFIFFISLSSRASATNLRFKFDRLLIVKELHKSQQSKEQQ